MELLNFFWQPLCPLVLIFIDYETPCLNLTSNLLLTDWVVFENLTFGELQIWSVVYGLVIFIDLFLYDYIIRPIANIDDSLLIKDLETKGDDCGLLDWSLVYLTMVKKARIVLTMAQTIKEKYKSVGYNDETLGNQYPMPVEVESNGFFKTDKQGLSGTFKEIRTPGSLFNSLKPFQSAAGTISDTLSFEKAHHDVVSEHIKPDLAPFYDIYNMRAYRFQHDVRRVSFCDVEKFKPFLIPEDIKLYMDVKIQKFPSKRFLVTEESSNGKSRFEFDDFFTDLVQKLGSCLDCLWTDEDEYRFVESGMEERFTKCKHLNDESSLNSAAHTYCRYYSSVKVQSPPLNGYNSFLSPNVYEVPINGLVTKDTASYVCLSLSIARMRSGLRGLAGQIEELDEELKVLETEISETDLCLQQKQKMMEKSSQRSRLIEYRKKLTSLCVKAIMATNFFTYFSDSRNASLSVLHFFVDFLVFGSPEVIFSVGKLDDSNLRGDNSFGGNFADFLNKGARSTVIPSINIQLLKLVYDFYILRLYQTRKTHYQTLNMNSVYGSSAYGLYPNNSYDESTYRYIMLLRSMLDTISVLLCLRMPAGTSDVDFLLEFVNNIWHQSHLSKSAKNTSVYILFVSISLMHRDLLQCEPTNCEKLHDRTNGKMPSPGCVREEVFIGICAQALQYRVADVRLHARRYYWLVRTVHPDLHERIQTRIRENGRAQGQAHSSRNKNGCHLDGISASIKRDRCMKDKGQTVNFESKNIKQQRDVQFVGLN